MASFDDKNLRLPNAPDYTNIGKGIDRARPNDAFGSLFKGIGDVINTGVTAIDENNQQKIRDELYAGVDAIRGAQGVDAAVQSTEAVQTAQLIPDQSNTPSGGGVKTPAAIDSATSEIARLQAAYKDGKIGDSMYWAKVEALTRQVRARYPGYREEIDKTVSSITGSTPANALRRSLLEDLQKKESKTASAQERQETFIRNNMNHLSPEARKRFNEGNRSSSDMASYEAEIGNSQANDTINQKRRAQLALDAEEGRATVENAEGVAVQEVNQFVNKTMDSGISGAGGSELLKRVQGMLAKNTPPTAEEIATIRSQFALIKSQTLAGINEIMNRPLRPGSGKNYNTLIKDVSKVDNIRKLAMAPIDQLEEALKNGDFGLFVMSANATKAMQDHDTRKVLESNGFWREMQAAREVLGREAFGTYLAQPGNMTRLNSAMKSLNDLSLFESVNGKGKAGNQLQRLIDNAPKDSQGRARPDPAATRSYLDEHSRILGGDKTPNQAIISTGNTFYAPDSGDIIMRFQEGERDKVFAKLSTPEITKNMIKIKGESPQTWNNYKDWASRNFYAVNKQTIDNVVNFAKNDIGATVAVDEKGRLRVIDYNPSGTGAQSPGAAMVRQPRLQALQASLDRFNRGLDALEPIYTSDGLVLKDALGPVYQQMGLAVKEDKESGNADSPKSKSSSLGNQVQLAAFTADDNAVPGLRDSELLTTEGESPLLSLTALDGPTAANLSSGRYAPLLNLIGRAEAPRGYNQIFGRGREAPLTEMTISEVYDLQRRMVASGSESSALGKYQTISKTLKGVVKAAGLDPDTTKFTPEIQDRLAIMLAQGRGLNRFLRGELDAEKFADSLAEEWAGFPLASGRSFYKGVGSNNATVSRQAVMQMLQELKLQNQE